MIRAAALALVLAIAASARADVPADPLVEAKRLESQLEFEPALVIVEKLIAQGGNERDRFLELNLFAGKLAAGLDRGAVAEEHFARVLALDPRRTLPDGTSPKITGPFDAARARTAVLRVSAKTEARTASLVVESDALNLVGGISVLLVDGRELRGSGTQLAVPASPRVDQISALDAFGNRLWTQTIALPLERVPGADRPLYARWQLYAVLGAGGLAAGGLGAWRMHVAQNEFDRLKAEGGHDYSQLHDVEQRGDRWALVANIGFGVGAAGVLAATILYITHRDESHVYLTATPSSVGLVGRF